MFKKKKLILRCFKYFKWLLVKMYVNDVMVIYVNYCYCNKYCVG